MATNSPAPSPDTSITIKVIVNGKDENRKFKLPLKDLGANTLPDKLRALLTIPLTQDVVFERYSDSSASFVTLDSSNPSVYKQLYRAAKAKNKLKIRVTATDKPVSTPAPDPQMGVPDRLTSRRYVHPYITEPSNAADNDSSTRLSSEMVNLKITPSATTLVPTCAESQRDESQETLLPPLPKLYHWPISAGSDFSEKTRAMFEKKNASIPTSDENVVEKEAKDEATAHRFLSKEKQFIAELAQIHKKQDEVRKVAEQSFCIPGTSFTICCNNCDKAIPDSHWHCGICNNGDFDLCGDCVDKGNLCEKEDHWLIKRFVKEGNVINSTTETIAPKKTSNVEEPKEIPGAFNTDKQLEETHEDQRTCNCCVSVFNETNFVTCTACPDYDLCIPCHVRLQHGHHPSHTFEPASKDTNLDILATTLCAPGRNMRHWAICDGCNKDIYGIRHKCMTCPDWDYCSTCVKKALRTHPGHRLVPLYEPVSHKPRSFQHHVGIYCDGPLCKEKDSYIQGDRYKCAVCHDTDFCANCEALPKLQHNRTHPLIKFKTPVRNVSVTTMGEKPNGEQMLTMGDQIPPPQTSSKSTETTPAAPSANAATQVQTVAKVKPIEVVKEEPKDEDIKPQVVPELDAHFIRDIVADGSQIAPSQQFKQVWTIRNPGPQAWPAGCNVCFVGGDGMLDVDPNHPSHVTQIYKAIKSDTIDRVVEVGEEVDFTIVMRTPEREGRAISYWRLKAADGVPFGHKLWCDVDVRNPEPAVKVEEPVKNEPIENIAKHAMVEDDVQEEEKEEAQAESKMIFPKLDKESPVSSTHEAKAEVEVPAAPFAEPVSAIADRDLLEDVESLELDGESESDEGFLTDEEYELIASGDEMEEAKNGRK